MRKLVTLLKIIHLTVLIPLQLTKGEKNKIKKARKEYLLSF